MIAWPARPTTVWGGVQRRVRRVVPAPIRRADLAIFRALARSELPVIGPALPRLSRAANHSLLWLAIGAASATFGGRFGRRAALRGVLALGATSALTNLPAKLLTGRERPTAGAVPEARRLARVPTSTSFPSGHSASAFAFATGASLELPRLRVPLFALASAIATSRVYTGVHYPGDVLAGSAIGIGIARMMVRTWPLAERRPATVEHVATDPSLVGPDGEGLVVVRNDGAGYRLAPGPGAQLRDAFPQARYLDVETGEALTTAIRRAAAQARILAVAGGDGSASAGAAVAHEAVLPLAVFAAGTLNHLATDLGAEELGATIDAVRSGRVVRMDVGELDGRVFVNAASVGTYPQLVVARERIERRIGKWPAALWGVVRTLRTARPIELDVDGRPRRVWVLFVGNCRYEGDGVFATRRLRLDDGALDVRILSAEHPWARTRVAVSLAFGRVRRSPVYERWSATELHVRSRQGPLQLAVDGETSSAPDEFVVRKRPGALQVLQPSPAPEVVTGRRRVARR